jgi:sortase (surface protein transpeptidase)
MGPTVRPTLTLISCYPYMVDTQRIVVTAELEP